MTVLFTDLKKNKSSKILFFSKKINHILIRSSNTSCYIYIVKKKKNSHITCKNALDRNGRIKYVSKHNSNK